LTPVSGKTTKDFFMDASKQLNRKTKRLFDRFIALQNSVGALSPNGRRQDDET